MKPESTLPNHTRVLIIGSGPAGYTAAIYAARANLSPTLLEGLQPGGQLTTTTDIENFPGFPDGIDANELMENMRKQAESFGTKMLQNTCTNAQLNVRPFQFTLDNGDNITADSVIIATGASAKYLGLPDEQKYMGRGVSACATCDGFFYRKKIVAVVGGGDTACEEASYLAGLASKVYLIVRKPFLRASKIMQERVLTNEKIEVLFETNTIGLYGENGVEGAKLVYRKGENDEKVYDLPIDGFFLAIGHHPNSELFKDYLETDTNGFIVTKDDTPCTDVPGVYVAGDVADPKYRQAIIAAGSGAKAAMEAEKYLAQ
ncbi:MAG: thioredoxin-disulfide reductase [Bacteroidaceae bacterium]|jgi:thioredoxin reductase (NADPH)|nr:thioredoxin-disulfide reductase [Bacteroidaceae bacterium]MBQ5621371.1 thioredoxin-disulfide reductase [Bacteroidaceae bacterium]MBQ5680867.1 thioredoxin-disulfide reductase [Bacteroidaceae bacterium]MBQ5714180.1 thioredoxin-disulfide reductase [Bacteroidaceae bacterium]MBQ5871619.1 thioredoxin-disulfide reductase [Bacteroidaceae bacterium]